MKSIFKQVISRGSYDLAALLAKIDTYHIEGKLTDAERDELYALARKDAAPSYDVVGEINALWAAVRALQQGEATEPEEGSEDDYPAYKQPTGAHDAYQNGDRMAYTDGKRYTCKMDNCVWSPDVYPAAWELVK